MQRKKLLAIFIAILLFCLTACKENPKDSSISDNPTSSTSSPTASAVISMLYNSKDSFNPFTCKTAQNRILTQLMYDTLVVINNNYEAEYNIAESAVYENKQITVKLRSLQFSDGATLTAQDVVFSFETAKKNSSNYSASLSHISSAKATDNVTVVFNLDRHDPYSINLLTFPIIKYGSDQLKDSDNRELPPIGCGKYVLNSNEKTLIKNDLHSGNYKIASIRLVDSPDSESVNQTVSAGGIDYYFTDLADNVIPKMNGTSADIPQNRIVFLGVNANNSIMSNMYFRQAVSSALNREDICKTAYFSKATAAKGLFSPFWKEATSLQTIETTPNLTTTTENLKNAGITKKDEQGYYLLNNNKRLVLTLLVSSDNSCRMNAAEIIKKNLNSVGIYVEIKAVTNEQFKTLVTGTSYDMYLGEVRLENNMDPGGLVELKSGSALVKATTVSNTLNNTTSAVSSKPTTTSSNTSVSSSFTAYVPEITLTTKQAYKGYCEGIYNIQDLITAYTAELPTIPICFRSGLVIYSDKLGSGISPIVSDVFHGIENLK